MDSLDLECYQRVIVEMIEYVERPITPYERMEKLVGPPRRIVKDMLVNDSRLTSIMGGIARIKTPVLKNELLGLLGDEDFQEHIYKSVNLGGIKKFRLRELVFQIYEEFRADIEEEDRCFNEFMKFLEDETR